MKNKKFLCLMVLPTLLSSCGTTASSSTTPLPIKEMSALVCYSENKNDEYFGKHVYMASKAINAKANNKIDLINLELGTNGTNYTALLNDELSKKDYDFVIVVGEKANFYLSSSIESRQGLKFISIDSQTNDVFDNQIKIEYSPEELGYIASTVGEGGKLGYLSTFTNTFDDRMVYGFLKGADKKNIKNNVYLNYLEETYNFDKTKAYTKQLYETYAVDSILEKTGDNLQGLLQETPTNKSKIISIGSDYLGALDAEEKQKIQNIIIKNYEVGFDKAVEQMSRENILPGKIYDLKVKDNAISLLKENEVIKDLKESKVSIEKLEDQMEYLGLRDKVVKDTNSLYTPKYTVDIGYHEAIPNCQDTNDWKYAPRYGADNGMKPVGWTAVGVWSTIYAQEGFDRAKNTGIEFKNMRIWGYTDEVGWKLIEYANPVGSFYDENFVNDYHKDFPSNYYNNKETKTTRIKLDNANLGFNYHPFSSQNDLASIGLSNIKYIISTMDVRLVTWDKNQPSDLDKAKYVANIGGDWWSYKGATWKPDWSANRDICVGQFRTIAKDWKTLYMSNIPVELYDNVVGNAEFLTKFE